MFKKIILIIIVIILLIGGLAGLTKLGYINNYLGISCLETANETNNYSEKIIEEEINSGDIEVQVEGKNNLLDQIFNSKLERSPLSHTIENESNDTMADIIAEKDQGNKKEYIILNNKIIAGEKSNTGVELAGEEDDNTNLETNEEYADIEKPDYRTPIFVHEDLQENYNEPDHYDSTISVYEEFLDREYTSNLGDDVLIRVDLDSINDEAVEEFELKDETGINVFNTEKNIKGSEAITGLGTLR